MYTRDQQITTCKGIIMARLRSSVRELEVALMKFCFDKLGAGFLHRRFSLVLWLSGKFAAAACSCSSPWRYHGSPPHCLKATLVIAALVWPMSELKTK